MRDFTIILNEAVATEGVGDPTLWTVFFVLVFGLLGFDLLIVNRKLRDRKFRTALGLY